MRVCVYIYTLHAKKRKANWIGHISRNNCVLKHVIKEIMEGLKWREGEEQEVSSYCMIVRKLEDNENWQRKH
jgi:hypothetical protein